MDEDAQEDNSYVVIYRSPVFSKDEIKALVELVGKHKHIILNKCTNSTTNHAKDAAWMKICKEINRKGFKHKRTVDSLKIKWENLKKEARKMSKNLLDVKSDLNDVLAQMVILINEADTNVNVSEVPQDNILETINDMVEENDNNLLWDDSYHKQSDESNDGDQKRGRSLNFSPQETSLLLKCVRDEKDAIFCKDYSGQAVSQKRKAWSRITANFNKTSPLKRNTKVLRTKFYNMKQLAKNVNAQKFYGIKIPDLTEILEDDSDKVLVRDDIKKMAFEENLDYKQDMDTDNDTDDDNVDLQEMHDTASKPSEDTSDPLSIVLSGGDSGTESISQFDNKEVAKLKLALLKYKMETAKLERQRIQQALEAESSERQSKAVETSLRLRAARLAVVAAESKLPRKHPALHYNQKEKQARQYLQEFRNA